VAEPDEAEPRMTLDTVISEREIQFATYDYWTMRGDDREQWTIAEILFHENTTSLESLRPVLAVGALPDDLCRKFVCDCLDYVLHDSAPEEISTAIVAARRFADGEIPAESLTEANEALSRVWEQQPWTSSDSDDRWSHILARAAIFVSSVDIKVVRKAVVLAELVDSSLQYQTWRLVHFIRCMKGERLRCIT